MPIHTFQTEVNQLLYLIIHSLYSHREIFLRELVSNASDALDKLKFLTLTDPRFKDAEFDPGIHIEFDHQNGKWVSVSDNGIGMNEEDLVENLGTIAGSGTRKFVDIMTGNARKDVNLIGQFGVGFYSAFMVSHKVEVISRKAGEDRAFKWISDGKSDYETKETERDTWGTTVICHLNEEGSEYANRWKIESIVKKYSNHIPFPIYLHYQEVKKDKEKKESEESQTIQVNAASAFWKRLKNEITEDEYREFYRNLTHEDEDPLLHIHTHAEGTLEYSTLFYIPRKAPFDMFQLDYRPGIKLYVKRVFITDDDRELMPGYLRFVRGIIDSEDIPLNVSRETLQKNRILTNIRASSVKKILSTLQELLKDDRTSYESFYEEFRRPMKEGMYQDVPNRDVIRDLLLYKSTATDGWTTLSEYRERMKPDQKAIYYVTGGKENTLKNSPVTEMYRQKGIEVLVMDDEIDEIIIPVMDGFDGKEFTSVNRSDAARDIGDDSDIDEAAWKPVIDRVKEVLKDEVKDVRLSSRLSESPSCIVVDETDPTVQMQHLMKVMGQEADVKPILEINPRHDILKKLKDTVQESSFEDVSWILLDQALLIEGAEIENPTRFVGRLNRLVSRAL